MTAKDKTHLNPRWTGRHRSLTVLREPVWERQPGERARDFSAFQAYRDLAPSDRSIVRVVDIDGRALGTLESLSTRWRWVDRAAESDDDRDRIRRAQRNEAVAEMNDRHGRQAKALLNLLMQPGNTLAQRLATPEGQKALASIPTDELLRLTMAASKVFTDVMRAERLARGEADVQVGVQGVGAGDAARGIMGDPEAIRHVHEALKRARVGRIVPVEVVEGGGPPALGDGQAPRRHEQNGSDVVVEGSSNGKAEDLDSGLDFLNGSARE